MATVVNSFGIEGVDAVRVEIEASSMGGIPMVSIIGLGDQAVTEAAGRLEAALVHSGFKMPSGKAILNLAPGDIRKRGSHYDLGMALALLQETKQINGRSLSEFAFIGELSLNAGIRRSNGILSMTVAAKEQGFTKVMIPTDNTEEASVIKGIEIIGVSTLKEAIGILEGKQVPSEIHSTVTSVKENKENDTVLDDFSDVFGQDEAVFAAMIASAGGHNMLMIGEPGCGKSMIAKRIPSILPPMSDSEALETTRIHSIAGEYKGGGLMRERPFRAPHHNISMNALIGGGKDALPGEITLAHNGVLFLDEFTEFSQHTLDSLRQPLEDKKVTISRVNRTNVFPANFMLVAACNPCPCGYRLSGCCTCTDREIYNYRKKISGPIYERIDIQILMNTFKMFGSGGEILFEGGPNTTKEISDMVLKAREIQSKRFMDYSDINLNCQMHDGMLKKFCILTSGAEELFRETALQRRYSARVLNRMLRVMRTIADVEGSNLIDETHVRYAAMLRSSF